MARTEAPTVRGKDVFIVGGGNSAGQAAMLFSSYAKSIMISVRSEGFQITVSHYLIGQIARKSNIQVAPWTQVVSVTGASHLDSIRKLKQGTPAHYRRADALFVMIGADAKTDWLPEKLLRDDHGYVCTGRDVTDLSGWDSKRTKSFPAGSEHPRILLRGRRAA